MASTKGKGNGRGKPNIAPSGITKRTYGKGGKVGKKKSK